MRASIIVVPLAVVALLAGCTPAGTARPVATSSSTAGQAATASPRPTPSASPTPAAVTNIPGDPSTWILTYDGAAGISVGQPITPFAPSTSLVAVDDTFDCPPGFWSSRDQNVGVVLTLLQAGSRGTDSANPLLDYASAGIGTVVDPPIVGSPATSEGIRVGSTLEQLRAAYPDLTTGHSKYEEATGYTTLVSGPVGGRYLVFQTGVAPSGESIVVHIQSSSFDSVVDLCD